MTDIYKNGQWLSSVRDRIAARLDDTCTLASVVAKLVEKAALSEADLRDVGLIDYDESLEYGCFVPEGEG